MILLTGDIHGDVRSPLWVIQRHGLTPDDLLILLGDVGPIFCIHGNHEERPFNIPSYHEVTWHGGTVYVEDDFSNLLFAKDGEIYDLDGKKAIVIGGAYSVDKYYRLQRGMNWFPNEQPSDEIKQKTEKQLSAVNWNVDVVLTHTCPQKYVPIEAFLPGLDQSMVDHSTEEWLDRIEDRLNYKDWFCGHWHIDKRVDKMHFMMRSVEAL